MISRAASVLGSKFFTDDLETLTFTVHPRIKSVCDQLTPPDVQRNFDGSTNADRAFWLTAMKTSSNAGKFIVANKSLQCEQFGPPPSLNYDTARRGRIASHLKNLVGSNREESRESIY